MNRISYRLLLIMLMLVFGLNVCVAGDSPKPENSPAKFVPSTSDLDSGHISYSLFDKAF